ncbi:ASC1-like protein 1 [Canna indica]|uniref:ASC1-like protein 1 n=1 Tax=Canna indica TaxID=4628 RepID=A0AAQ3Q2I4_9LILI|nr:ASC1-like protein 1 [Canna indica]
MMTCDWDSAHEYEADWNSEYDEEEDEDLAVLRHLMSLSKENYRDKDYNFEDDLPKWDTSDGCSDEAHEVTPKTNRWNLFSQDGEGEEDDNDNNDDDGEDDFESRFQQFQIYDEETAYAAEMKYPIFKKLIEKVDEKKVESAFATATSAESTNETFGLGGLSNPLPPSDLGGSLIWGEMDVMEAFRLMNWEQESYPAYEDFVALPFFALFFPTVRFFLDRFVFEILATRLISKTALKDLNAETERRRKISKFKESAWKFVYFFSAEVLSLTVTYNEPWFTSTRYFWVGPGDQVWPDQKIKLKLKAVYMYAAGFYTYSIFALMFWETRRSDFGVSMSHHVATVILIVLSYIFRFARVGSVVLALHDASDVFLEVGKMSKYSGADWLANSSFLLFVASWVLCRLTYFPFWILRSTSYEVLLTLDKEKHKFEGPIYYYVFNTLLFSLLVLHIYWWVLIYRMLVKQIQARGHVGDDVRSDSESEEEHED